MKNLLISILLVFIGLAPIISQNINTQKEKTSLKFKIKNFGLIVSGSFSEFDIIANYDKNNLANSYFSGKAVIKSIDTGNDSRNKSLKKKEYFDSEQFPEMTLASNKIIKTSDDRYEFIGELFIKGVTKEITFPFTIKEKDNQITVKGEFEINRLDFNVGKSSRILNKKVKVSITFVGDYN